MTVAELIERLSTFDPADEVGVYDNGPGDGADTIDCVELSTNSLRQRPGARFGVYDEVRVVLIRTGRTA